jgi:glycosyltransferase involved in cell wall biosynthesis
MDAFGTSQQAGVMRAPESLRVVVLWAELSGYLAACLRTAAARGVELLVVSMHAGKPPKEGHPYDLQELRLPTSPVFLNASSREDTNRLRDMVTEMRPHGLLVSGWRFGAFRKLSRQLKRQGARVIVACDNPWRGTVRQWSLLYPGRFIVPRMSHALWVPGTRGVKLARRLGFSSGQILQGFYTCDDVLFGSVGKWRRQVGSVAGWPKRFLFAGLFIERKGVRELVEGYREYRRRASRPWELWCAGSGPLAHSLEGQPGIRMLGFLQPTALAEAMREVGAFILPSRKDHWGLAIHEAGCASLPILCTTACGSSDDLVVNGSSGFVFPAREPTRIADAMIALTESDVPALGERSAQLAGAFSLGRWGDSLLGFMRNDPACTALAESRPFGL